MMTYAIIDDEGSQNGTGAVYVPSGDQVMAFTLP
jgi:hypothetical protein